MELPNEASFIFLQFKMFYTIERACENSRGNMHKLGFNSLKYNLFLPLYVPSVKYERRQNGSEKYDLLKANSFARQNSLIKIFHKEMCKKLL